MLFSSHPHQTYGNPIVHEVICQLRFPAILSINTTEPADFQEKVRNLFPQYTCRQEKPAQAGGTTVANHTFISADNRWKLNLTKEFISLSTLQYQGWEEFAHQLDKSLAEFIRIYQPAYFQRVGLRYVNLVSRQKLDLGETPWNQLIAPAYLGAMAQEDVRFEDVLSTSSSFVLKLSSSAQAKLQASPVQLQKKTPQGVERGEAKFLLDLDLSMTGNTPCTLSAAALETLHGHSTPIFQGFLTDTLREAMEPLN